MRLICDYYDSQVTATKLQVDSITFLIQSLAAVKNFRLAPNVSLKWIQPLA